MSLLDDLCGAYRIPQPRGRVVSFALDGELAEEREAERELEAKRLTRWGKVPSRQRILTALEGGRAYMDGQICEAADLSWETVRPELYRLCGAGLVEEISIGGFRMWALSNWGEA